MASDNQYTVKIVDWVKQLNYNDIPPEIVEITKKFILDWFGYTMYSRQEHTAGLIRNIMLESCGDLGEATILGDAKKSSVLTAAFVNGAMAHMSELDDTDFLTQNHPGDSIIAASLAIAEKVGLSGRDFIPAVIAGYEVTTRVGLSIMPSHFQRGWHPSGSINTIGAGIAAGKALGLNKEQHLHGLGIASSWVCGNFAHVPERGMVKDLDTGRAAHNGLLAAIYAKHGFTSCTDTFENPKGFAYLYADSLDYETLVTDLGLQYRILGVGHKVFSACRHASAALDSTVLLFNENKIEIDDIDSIDVYVSSAGYFFINDPKPWQVEKGLSGSRFSGQFNVAVAVLEGKEGLHKLFTKEYVEKKLADPRIRNIAGKIKIIADDSLAKKYPGKWVATVKISTKDKKCFEKTIDCPIGEQGNPINWEELFAKVETLTTMAGAEKQNVVKLCNLVKNLEDVENIKGLPGLLCIK